MTKAEATWQRSVAFQPPRALKKAPFLDVCREALSTMGQSLLVRPSDFVIPSSFVLRASAFSQFRMCAVVRATFGLRCRSPRSLSRRQEPNRDKRAERA